MGKKNPPLGAKDKKGGKEEKEVVFT